MECLACVEAANMQQAWVEQAQVAREQILREDAVSRKLFRRPQPHPFEEHIVPWNVPLALVYNRLNQVEALLYCTELVNVNLKGNR